MRKWLKNAALMAALGSISIAAAFSSEMTVQAAENAGAVILQAHEWKAVSDTVKQNDYGPDGTAAGGNIAAGDYMSYDVDFGNGGKNTCLLEISAPESENGKKVELHLDGADGQLLGSVAIAATGDETVFADHYVENIDAGITGQHVLYVVFPENTKANIDFITMSAYNGTETEEAKTARLQWFRDAKFGQFIHFGAYSGAEGEYQGRRPNGGAEWIMKLLKISKEDYAANVAKTFNPKEFDASKYAKLAKETGQKYLVFTTRHHEGFSMFETEINEFKDYQLSTYGDYKGEDPVKALADACKAEGIAFGTYYSIPDWHDKAQSDYDTNIDPALKADYIQRMKGQLRELIVKYDPEIMWFDGNWMNWWTHEDALNMYRYVRTLKPSIVINNRVGTKSIMVGDYGTPEQTIPAEGFNYAWESCMTLNGTWGYKYYDNNWKSPATVVEKLVDISSKGGNYLLNIGPDGQGRIPEKTTEIFQEVGTWMSVYGDSIYDASNTCFTGLPSSLKATTKDGKVYLHCLKWNPGSVVVLPKLKNNILSMKVMGTDTAVEYTVMKDQMVLKLPNEEGNKYDTVIEMTVEGVPEAEPKVDINIAAQASKVEASAQYSGSFDGAKAVDGKNDTRWATPDNVKNATLTLTYDKPVTINEAEFDIHGSAKNYITKYQIEYMENGEWKVAYTGTLDKNTNTHVAASAKFNPVTSDQIRLNILESLNPTIWEFSLYNRITYDLKITAPKATMIVNGIPFTVSGTAEGGKKVKLDVSGKDFAPENPVYAEVNADGTWSCEVDAPSDGKLTVVASLYDAEDNIVAVTECTPNVRNKGENLAKSASVSTSSSYRESDYGGKKVQDSNLETRWAPKDNTDPAPWIVLDFGAMKGFDTIVISEWLDNYINAYRCTEFNLEYFDGTDWKVLHAGTTIGEELTVIKEPVVGSKVRLNLTGVKEEGKNASILEFEVYSTKEVEIVPDITEVAPLTDMTVEEGTAFADLNLPETVSVTLNDGNVKALPVVWDETNYSSEAGEYTLTGAITLEGEITNSKGLTASIKVTVKEPVPEIDKTSLESYLNTAKGLVEDGTVDTLIASVQDEFKTAIEQGEAMMNDPDADQESVNAAADALRTVIDKKNLVAGNKEELNALIAEVNDLLANAGSAYPQSAVDALKAELAAAEAVSGNGDALQGDVDAALTGLQNAKTAFEGTKLADWSALEALVVKGTDTILPEIEAGKYAEGEALTAYQTMYNAAKVMLEAQTAPQTEIDKMAELLGTAEAGLKKAADKTALKAAIEKAAGLDLSKYTEETAAAVTNAKEAAEALLNDKTLSTEEQVIVDNAAKTLEDAIAALEKDNNGGDNNGGNNNGDNNNGGNNNGGNNNGGNNNGGNNNGGNNNGGNNNGGNNNGGNNNGGNNNGGNNGGNGTSGGQNTNGGNHNAIKTGDEAPIVAAGIGMLMALLLAAGVVLYRRRVEDR